MKTPILTRASGKSVRTGRTEIFRSALSCLWIAALLFSGVSPLYYTTQLNSDSAKYKTRDLRIITTPHESEPHDSEAHDSEKKSGSENSGPSASGAPGIAIERWFIAGQSVVAGGLTGNDRQPQALSLPQENPSSDSDISISPQQALAGALKRLEFTLLGLKPTGVS